MTPERWQELKQLVGSALAVPEAEREAFVRGRAAQDSELCGQALSLLSSADLAEGFLSAPAVEAAGSILDSVVEESHKPIPVGALFGPYQIVGLIGAGGMGEVYRARDERLKREVAIKVLPSLFSQDHDRLRRFEQEARAAGGLNHPNILAIHDIGSREGAPYVVSELLEGQTLRERLVSGPLPSRKAIDYAIQVARGLAAAHEKGIVHRDLKPENLFITKDGRVKILDFGLAKVTRPESAAARGSMIPTTPLGTEPGVVMGTAGYMSPEQVRGEPTDARSDIFSLGAILYEMLSGKRAFQGSSPVETMSAILKEDPPELSVTSRNVSPGLERIVRHCLEKSPEERFHSARDLAFDLETLSTATPVAGIASRRPVRGIRTRLVAAGAAAFVLALAVWAGTRLAPQGSLTNARVQRLTFRRGNILSARFAPDGQTVVYGAAWEGRPSEVFTVRTDSLESRPLGFDHADVLSVSSRGEVALHIAKPDFRAPNVLGTLASVPLGGGVARELLENVWCAQWAPDGENLAVIRLMPNGMDAIEYPIGHSIYESDSIIPTRLLVSPTGDQVVFTEEKNQNLRSIWIADRSGSKRELAKGLSSLTGIAWSRSTGEILFTGGRTKGDVALRAVSQSGRERVVWPSIGGLFLLDAAPDGRLLIERTNARQGVIFASSGSKEERDLGWLDGTDLAGLSRDGRRILFSEAGEGGGRRRGAYLRGTDGSPAVRLGDGIPMAISPDDKWVLALTDETPSELVLLPTRAGTTRRLRLEGIQPRSGAFAGSDGTIAVLYSAPGQPTLVSLVPFEGGPPKPLPLPGISGTNVLFARNGSQVAYETTGRRINIATLVGGAVRTLAGQSLEPNELLVDWTADGRFLIAQTVPTQVPAVVSRIDTRTGEKTAWKKLLPADGVGVIDVYPIVLAADGSSYAYGYKRVESSDLYVVEGLR